MLTGLVDRIISLGGRNVVSLAFTERQRSAPSTHTTNNFAQWRRCFRCVHQQQAGDCFLSLVRRTQLGTSWLLWFSTRLVHGVDTHHGCHERLR
jgi:hypothetical protein